MIARQIVDAVYRVRFLLAALLVPVVVLAAWAASRIGVDNAVHVWFVDDDPALAAYDAFHAEFGNDEIVVLAVHDPDGIVTVDGLARVARVSEAVGATDGIVDVTSLTTVDHVRIDEGWEPAFEGEAPPIVVGPLIDALPTSPAAAEVLRRRVADDPLIRGQLVSADGKTALVLGRMGTFEGMDARRDVILTDLEGRLTALGEPVHEAGIGVIFSALNRASTRDMLVVGSAAYVVIFGLLTWIFGRPGPVVLTLGAVGVAALLTMGLYGAFGRQLNMVTMAMPTLILILGVADCVHMLHRIAHVDEPDPAERARIGVAAVLWPCLFTSLTTAAGLIGLATAQMQVVRDLGWFAAAGVMIEFGLAVLFVLLFASHPAFVPRPRTGESVRAAVIALGDLSMRHAPRVLGVTVLAVLAGAWGMSRLQVDTYSIDYFYGSHPVRKDSAFIEQNFGPYTPLELVVAVPEGGRTVEVLGAIAAWEDRMRTDPDVGWTRSIAGTVRRLNQVLTDGAPASYVVPPDDVALDQALLMYESDPDSNERELVDAAWTHLRVTVGVRMTSARRIGKTIDRLVAMAELPPSATIVPSGYLPLYVTMMDYVVRSQITSFAVAFVLIFALLAVLFRSIRLAALAVPPNLLPVFVTLGVMGATGIRLDVATVTIAALVLGLVVDDTTHFIYAYREGKGLAEEACRHALGVAGPSMTTTSVVLVLGFAVLGFATVKSVAFFGLLSAVAMGAALVGDLVVLPALLVALRPALAQKPG